MEIELPPRCDKTWVCTASGRRFWPLNPRADEVFITDIAHHLSNICRFTGAVRKFYSVAQHSVLASWLLNSRGLDLARWGLLHDASEAYICDVARPLKPYLGDYRAIEGRLELAISDRFVLPWPMPEDIKEADSRLLATERRDLMPRLLDQCRLSTTLEPLVSIIHPWSPVEAREKFLDRFRELFPHEVVE